MTYDEYKERHRPVPATPCTSEVDLYLAIVANTLYHVTLNAAEPDWVGAVAHMRRLSEHFDEHCPHTDSDLRRKLRSLLKSLP